MHIFCLFKVIKDNFIDDDDDDLEDDDDDLEDNNRTRFLNAFRTTLRDEHV